ncbi:MAG: hypothetical protein U0234_26600 [Sandaracinus sp.]
MSNLARGWMLAAHALLALVPVGLVLGSVATAQADETVVVLGLTSIDGDDEYARNLSGVLRHAAEGVRGWSVSERDVALANLELVAGCEAPDPDCLAQIASTVGAQRLVFGTITRTSGTPYQFAVSLHSYSVASGAIEENLERTLSSTRTDIEDLREPAREMVNALANVPHVGTIRVTATAHQEVRIDGTVVGSTDGGGVFVASNVTAGSHEVVVGSSASQTVSVSDGAEALVAIQDAHHDEGPGVNWAAVALLSGAGLAVVGMIVSWAELLSLSNDQAYTAHRETLGAMGMSGDIACQDSSLAYLGSGPMSAHIRDVCSQGNTFEILQYVFLGVAVAAGATGIVLLVLDSSGGSSEEAATTVSLLPSFGPTHGSMDLRLRF